MGNEAPAAGLGIEDVTPSIAAAGPLAARETAVISIFEAATPAVVTVFDTTLLVSIIEYAQLQSAWCSCALSNLVKMLNKPARSQINPTG